MWGRLQPANPLPKTRLPPPNPSRHASEAEAGPEHAPDTPSEPVAAADEPPAAAPAEES